MEWTGQRQRWQKLGTFYLSDLLLLFQRAECCVVGCTYVKQMCWIWARLTKTVQFNWKKCYWIQYSWYWNVIFLLTLDRFFLKLHDVSTSHLEALVTSSSHERKHHVTKASRWEVETSWSFKKKRSKVSKKITFQYLYNSSLKLWKKWSLLPATVRYEFI